MEYQDTNSLSAGLRIDDSVKHSLRGAATTAGIAALIFIINTGLGIVSFFVDATRPKEEAVELEGFEGMGQMEGMENLGMGMGIFFLLISVIISVVIFYFLNRFSTLTKTGLNNNNQVEVSNGLRYISSYFKLMGILFILICGGALLVFFALLAGTGTAA